MGISPRRTARATSGVGCRSATQISQPVPVRERQYNETPVRVSTVDCVAIGRKPRIARISTRRSLLSLVSIREIPWPAFPFATPAWKPRILRELKNLPDACVIVPSPTCVGCRWIGYQFDSLHPPPSSCQFLRPLNVQWNVAMVRTRFRFRVHIPFIKTNPDCQHQAQFLGRRDESQLNAAGGPVRDRKNATYPLRET